MADEPDAVAMLALLNANPNILAVYDDETPIPDDAPSSYVRIYCHTYAEEADDLTMVSTDTLTYAYVHSVAESSSGARIVARNVKASLLDVVPVIAGRNCFPIRAHDSLPEPVREQVLGKPVMDQVDVYVLHTVAA